MNKLLLAILLLAGLNVRAQKITEKDLKEVRSRLVGTFDNQEQASANATYSSIVMNIKEIAPIKKGRTAPVKVKTKVEEKKGRLRIKSKTKQEDVKTEQGFIEGGYWMYAEQTDPVTPNKPTMQRLLYLNKLNNDLMVLSAYELKEPARYAGALRNPEILKNLTMDDLTEWRGCEIYLKKDEEGHYFGSTVGTDCRGIGQGAFTTSQVTIYPNLLIIWDRGWEDNDRQVWGPEKSGYRFRKFTLNR